MERVRDTVRVMEFKTYWEVVYNERRQQGKKRKHYQMKMGKKVEWKENAGALMGGVEKSG